MKSNAICAIATAKGSSALGVIRISGENLESLLSHIFTKKLTDRQRVAGQVAPGESIEAVFPDKDGNNQADLSSRTPFVRMWTSVKLIEPGYIGQTELFEEITYE